jgi:hypothetical protein
MANPIIMALASSLKFNVFIVFIVFQPNQPEWLYGLPALRVSTLGEPPP